MEKNNNISDHKGFLFRLSDLEVMETPKGTGRKYLGWSKSTFSSITCLLQPNCSTHPHSIEIVVANWLQTNQNSRSKKNTRMQRARHTAIGCLLGLRICFFLVQRTVTQKRERLIELLESFCANYWETVGGARGACVTQKRKKERKVIEEKMISGQPKSFLPRPLGIFITFRVWESYI